MSPHSVISRDTTRRRFLAGSLALSGAALLPRPMRAAEVSPNDRLQLGIIGCGGMGQGHLNWFAQQSDVKVVALCDVDRGHLASAHEKAGKDCRTFSDFRELLDTEGLDAVVITTPDHWHALTAIAAARAGKHIYCEKPLTNSVAEGRALCRAVQDAGVVLQTGSHERSSSGAAAAKWLIAEGKLGEIQHVHIHLPTDEPHLQKVQQLTEAPPRADAPAELDYDFWLGPAAQVPYSDMRCHFWWRFHLATGGGEMTDRGAHVLDLAHMILGLDDTGPVEIKASGKPLPCDFFDVSLDFEFENRYPNGLIIAGDNTGPRGVQFTGSEGKLFVAVHGGALTAEPASLLEGIELPSRPAHQRNWLDTIRGGDLVVAPVEAGHRTASACHLTNLAIRLGRGFGWDPATEQSPDAEVNGMLKPDMRTPWSLDG